MSIKSRDCSANNAERLVARRRARPGGQKFGTLQKRPREQLSASKMEAAGAAAPSTTRSRPLTFVNILTSFTFVSRAQALSRRHTERAPACSLGSPSISELQPGHMSAASQVEHGCPRVVPPWILHRDRLRGIFNSWKAFLPQARCAADLGTRFRLRNPATDDDHTAAAVLCGEVL